MANPYINLDTTSMAINLTVITILEPIKLTAVHASQPVAVLAAYSKPVFIDHFDLASNVSY